MGNLPLGNFLYICTGFATYKYIIMTKIVKSPFQFGTLATKDNFIDRVEDRALLKQLLSSHINTMLVSPRRWGKSSLVKMAMDELLAEDKSVRVCYIDGFSIGSEDEFYRVFASQVIACTSNKVERWISDAKSDKNTILQLPELLGKEKGLHIIVCIDEFQQLANLPQYKDMEGKMRSAWQQQEHVSYCFYGSKRTMMLEIFNNSNSPFYRFGQVIFMDKIAKEDWIPFITSSFEKTGKKCSAEYASRICDIVECHSWYLQQLCYFIWSYTDDEVDEDSYNRGLRQTLNINTPMFQNDTENLSQSQIEMLRAICNGETKLSSEDVKRRYSLGNPNTITKNKLALVKRDILDNDKGILTFVDPLYRIWLKG